MSTVKAFFLMFLPIWLLSVSEVSYARHAAVLIDSDDGSILYEQQANQAWFPASLTKVMTLYMAFDALKSGRISLYDEMSASGHAAAQPQSKLGLRRGEYITVENAILAVITRSANDAAVVLAERLGGTEENFAIKMTAKAHALGMHNTHFMNATGLPHDWQVTTARDMAVMAWRTQRNFPEYYQFFSAHSMFFRGAELRAINKFTANYPGAEGMKTGFTCGSGYNLIGAASQNGKHQIGVILGGMTSSERYELMMDMMDDGFDNQFSGGSNDSITAISASYAGTPPYQLGCGNRHSHHTAHNEERDNDFTVSPKTRYKRANLHQPAPRLALAKPVRAIAHHHHQPVKLLKPVALAKASAKSRLSRAPAVKKAGKIAAKASRAPVKLAKANVKATIKAKPVAAKALSKVKPAAKTVAKAAPKTAVKGKIVAKNSKKTGKG
ncbi:MAG: serine hydrolase [Methylococcales bacterium]